MPFAAARTAGAQDARCGSVTGTTIDSEATQPPPGPAAPSTGAATENASSVTCRSLTAKPVRRISASVRRSSAGSLMVNGVNVASGAASTASCTSAGACASRTSPTPVACSGQCAPTRVRTGTACRPAIRSMYTPSRPSRTAS